MWSSKLLLVRCPEKDVKPDREPQRANRRWNPLTLSAALILTQRAGAISATGGHHVRIAGCTFRNLGATAVSFAHGGLKKDTNYAAAGRLRLGDREYKKGLMLCPEVSDHAVWADAKLQ